jgi:glycosyltransferase involved in cell wall biosynthesis
VICFDSCALDTFKASKKAGIKTILDQSIGHIKTGIEVLKEEAYLHPEFADGLPTDVPSWLIERCTEEALVADWVLAASDYVRNSLIAHGVMPSRIVILPYGVDVGRFCPWSKRDGKVFRVLFVGGIGQRKGIKYLLEAFKRLRLQNAELILVGDIVGSGRGLSQYRDIVKHVSNVPHSEVHDWFQSADIFVYPSLHEGSALAIYEALASGLPVITTPNAGSVVRNGEDGYIVPIRDIEALMEKIEVLYRDRNLKEEMSLKSRQRAECFTWQHYRHRLAECVKSFLEEQRCD